MEPTLTLVCYCEETFQHKQKYIDHARNCLKGLHENNQQVVCAICRKAISSAAYFTKTHLNFHEGNKKYITFVETADTKSLDLQMKFDELFYEFALDVKRLECHVDGCMLRFAVTADLIGHRRKHHTFEKPLQCENCGMCFATSSEKSSHMRIHSTIKKFGCEICQKTFVRSSILKAHMRTHNGERPYECNTCGKKFTQSSSLNKHKKTHEVQALTIRN